MATAIAMSYGPTVSAGETQWSGYVENATYFRDKKGLSKFRNTAQAELPNRLNLMVGATSVLMVYYALLMMGFMTLTMMSLVKMRVKVT